MRMMNVDYIMCPVESNGKRLGGSIRIVKPYVHTFTARAKRRWIGRTVLHVYTSEFGAFPKSYYEPAILQGRILVNGVRVALSYKISNNDVLTHTVHMHEPAADLGESSQLQLIAETNDVIVVNKPCTLTVHPCGSYNHNSLLSMLEFDYGKKLHTIHRLDRLTSGLVVLAKTACAARKWTDALTQRECDKIYLARVKGRFPLNCETSTLSRINDDRKPPNEGKWNVVADVAGSNGDVDLRSSSAMGYWISNHDGTMKKDYMEPTDLLCEHSIDEWLAKSDTSANDTTDLHWFHVACPTRVSHHKDARCEAGSFVDLSNTMYNKSVKPAHTAFGVVSYDASSDSTVVVCRPFTGRSHQIRMHLQILGHPIVNDSKYGGDEPVVCKEARTELDALISEDVGGYLITDAVREENESFNDYIARTCTLCAHSESYRNARSVLEFLSIGRGIWLHALQITMEDEDGESHCYRTNVPAWACPEP